MNSYSSFSIIWTGQVSQPYDLLVPSLQACSPEKASPGTTGSTRNASSPKNKIFSRPWNGNTGRKRNSRFLGSTPRRTRRRHWTRISEPNTNATPASQRHYPVTPVCVGFPASQTTHTSPPTPSSAAAAARARSILGANTPGNGHASPAAFARVSMSKAIESSTRLSVANVVFTPSRSRCGIGSGGIRRGLGR